jgi:hypothetical protein
MKNYKIQKNNRGFVLLYVIVISSIVLAIAIGVTNIAFNEVKFSTSAKDTNDAFFAADTGVECALFWDNSDLLYNTFIGSAGEEMKCYGNHVDLTPSGDIIGPWTFTISNLGSSENSCVKVTVDKSIIPNTKITSVGQSNCNSSNYVLRKLEVTY